jgi:uncharacterized OB-fold protein
MATEQNINPAWSPADWPAGELLPRPTRDTDEFRSAAAEGRYLLLRCVSCAQPRLIPAPVCPYCGSRKADSVAARGGGTLVSWVRYHRAYLAAFAGLVPYVVGLVELDEGPRLSARLSGVDVPEFGLRLRMEFEHWADGQAIPVFVQGEGA